jgi:hypothetical protein
MYLTRVLLSVEHQLHAQLLKNALLSRSDIELVGETKGIVDSLMLIAAKKPDLWIHSWEERAEPSAAISYAYSIHPNLAVLRVNPDEPTGFLQVQVSSLSQLIDVASRSRPILSPSLEAAGDAKSR